MLEQKGGFRCFGMGLGLAQGLHDLPQPRHGLVAGLGNGPLHRQVLQGPAHLQDGTDLVVAQHAAGIFHNGDQGAQVALAAVIRHKGALPGPHLQKALLGQLRDAPVHHRPAHLHLPGQLPLRRQLGPHG